jgi:putative endonuclease
MPAKYTVYVLQSKKDGGIYIGHTDNLRARLARHHSGGVRATAHRRPLHLVLKENFTTRKEAIMRERWLKSGVGRKHLKHSLSLANRTLTA